MNPRALALRLSLLTLLLAGGPSPARAIFGLFDDGGPPAVDPGGDAPAAPAGVFQPARRPFQVGVHTLGFDNPGGVIQVQGMAGNCYAMAATAKLFYEAARFGAEGEPAGFTREEVAEALRAPGFPDRPFPVRGYASLAELTATPGLPDPERWMDEATRHGAGLRRDPPEEPAPPNAEALLDVYRLVSSTHYLHYVQSQAGQLIGSALRIRDGAEGIRRTQAETVAELKRRLPRGELGVLLIFNADPKVFFGHVVLAYKLVEGPGGEYSDVYVYENNTVYDPTTPETILRVEEATGRFATYTRAPGGEPQLAGDGNPYGYSFWNPATMVLRVLPDLNDDPRLRRLLAAKLEASDEATATLQASGDLLRDLTMRSPQEAPMRDAVAEYLRQLQRSQERLGTRPAWRDRDLSEDAGAAELNEYLERYSDRAIREVLPHVLPEDLGLEGTRLSFHPTDPNRATLDTTVVIEPGTEVDRLVEELERSLVLGGDPRIGGMLSNLAGAFSGETVRVKLRLELTKAETPFGLDTLRRKLGPYMPVPRLVASHTVIGSMRPGEHDPAVSDHRIEISERILDRALQVFLKDLGALSRKSDTIPGLTGGRRDVWFDLDRASLDCQEGNITVHTRFAGYVGVFDNVIFGKTGVNFQSNPEVYLRLTPARTRTPGVFSIRGARMRGWVRAGDGLGGLAVDTVVGALRLAAGWILPRVSRAANTAVNEQLSRFLSFAGGTSFALGRPTLTSARGRLVLDVPARPFSVDIGASLGTVFGRQLPMRVVDLEISDDRVVVLTSNAGR